MNIILMSIGTRGDMEPFLAIAEILKEKGHQVICALPEQFRNLTQESNVEFVSLGIKFIEMLDSDIGKAVFGGSGSRLNKILAYIKLAGKSKQINKELIRAQYEIINSENPDRIVYNGKTIYPIIWELDNPGKTILVSPLPYMHYVRDNSHVAFNSNFGPFLNKLTYVLANFGLIVTTWVTIKWLKITKKITSKQIKNAVLRTKAIYTISPALFPRPNYWNENIKILGYHQRNKTADWQPDKKLSDFLNKHDKILFITLGSMTNPEPLEKTELILEILKRNKIPAIINTASGGLAKPEKFNSEVIHFIAQIPYDWIFPKIYAVIHHGGSGTTHLGLKYGCATMIIPHIIDQFVWNKIIYKMGAGPEGIRINKIIAKNLESKILELMNNISFKNSAEQIAGKMEKEDFKDELYNTIIKGNFGESHQMNKQR